MCLLKNFENKKTSILSWRFKILFYQGQYSLHLDLLAQKSYLVYFFMLYLFNLVHFLILFQSPKEILDTQNYKITKDKPFMFKVSYFILLY